MIFGITKCSLSMYRGYKDFPEYASVGVLSKQYENLIADLDAQIAAGDTVLSIGANLEKIVYPKNTLYVAIENEEGDDIVLKGAAISGSRRIFLKDGFGYGNLGDQDIVVLSRSVDRLGLDDVEIYLKHEN